jgi:microcin C transport system permease protein
MSFLSPVNQARWARFRHNRRGYLSLWLFMLLFVFSLCELIANDRRCWCSIAAAVRSGIEKL